jgi:heme A synthase
MKFSFSSQFTRITLYLFINIIILSVVGRVVSLGGVSLTCNDWPFCKPITLFDWLKIAHVILVAISAALMLWLFIKAWREHRDDPKLLPLTTVTTVLFFGQAFVGAIQVIRGFPLHLVILHSLTALLLWISLISLVITSGLLEQDGTEFVNMDIRQRFKDFFILCKPLIVALLLLTTLGGLVVG